MQHSGKGGEEQQIFLITLTDITKHKETQPGGELLLGFLTLLTTHPVHAELHEGKSKPERLNNPTAICKQP